MPFAGSYRSSELVPSKEGQQQQERRLTFCFHSLGRLNTDNPPWHAHSEVKGTAPLQTHNCMGLSFHPLNVCSCFALTGWREGVPCLFSFCRKAEPVSENSHPLWEERVRSLTFMLNESDTQLQIWFHWCLSVMLEHSNMVDFPSSFISFIKFLL